MTVATMEKWLRIFNEKMKKENRNAILFLDNATCHPKLTLSDVTITRLPANATSVYGPWILVLFTHSNRTTNNFGCIL
jgi:hypothetical protein